MKAVSVVKIDHEDSTLDFKNENPFMQGFITWCIGKELLLAQEGDKVFLGLEKECGTTGCKSDAFIEGLGQMECLKGGRWIVPTVCPHPVDEENPHCYSTNLISDKNAHPQGNDKIASKTYAIR